MFQAIAALFKGMFTGDWEDFKGDSTSNKHGCLSLLFAAITAGILGLIFQDAIVFVIAYFILFVVFAILLKPKK